MPAIYKGGLNYSNGGVGVNYSTTEQVIGTWIDGKPIYQKTWSLTSPSGSSGTSIIDMSSIPVDNIIQMDGMIATTENVTPHGGGSFVLWFRTASSTQTPKNCIMCTVSNSAYRNATMYVTLRYTKTTD